MSEQKYLYSIYEISEVKPGAESGLGDCICEEYNRDEVIKKAVDYFEQNSVDNMEFGEGALDVKLIIHDEKTENETIEDLTIEWLAEDDGYDGGAFDCNTSRGVK